MGILSSFLVKRLEGEGGVLKHGDEACETSTINLLPFFERSDYISTT